MPRTPDPHLGMMPVIHLAHPSYQLIEYAVVYPGRPLCNAGIPHRTQHAQLVINHPDKVTCASCRRLHLRRVRDW
jgi:hypothetical protein